MKKFFSFLAAAAMLFTASCSNDDLGAEGDEAVISFSMNLNGVSSTKAIADGLKVDKLFYSVFEAKEANGETTYTHLHTYPAVEGIQFPYNLDIRLAKGKAYRVVFWAQDADCQAYTYTNGNVTVNYVGDNNDETRDAFCGYRDVETVTGSVKLDATLKRPFAQLNVGVTADDWTAAKHSGVDITVSKVTIDKVANQIDLVNDKISGEAKDLTYTYGAIPTQMLGVDLNGDKDTEDAGEQFHYLSMSYLLVEENEDVNATFTFSTAEQTGHEIALNVPVTPLQRNHRTNILGQILTGNVTFEIKIDANFVNDHNYPSKADELKELIENKTLDVIKLMPGVYEGTFELDTKDRNITIEPITTKGDGGEVVIKGRFGIAGGGTVTFNNIRFESGDFDTPFAHQYLNKASGYIIPIYVANVNINNCTFEVAEEGKGSIYFYAANDTRLNVKGSKFLTNGNYAIRARANVSVEDCEFHDMVRQCLQINGNPGYTQDVVFRNNRLVGEAVSGVLGVSLANNYEMKNIPFNVGGNDAPINNISYDPAKSSLILPNIDTHTFTGEVKEIVDETTLTFVTVNNVDELNAALNSSDYRIIYLAAGEYGTIVAKKDDKTIVGSPEAKVDAVNLNGAANLTLKNIKFDAAKAVMAYDGKGGKRYAGNIISGGANKNAKGSDNLVIDGCTFTGTFANGGTTIAFNDQGRGSGQSGNITIKNCTFNTTGGYVDIYTYYAGKGSMVIENNIFKSDVVDKPIYLGRYQSSTPVVVKGNAFNKVDTFENAAYIQDHSSYGVSFDASNNTFAE